MLTCVVKVRSAVQRLEKYIIKSICVVQGLHYKYYTFMVEFNFKEHPRLFLTCLYQQRSSLVWVWFGWFGALKSVLLVLLLCALINSDCAAHFALVCIGFILVSFAAKTQVQLNIFLKWHLEAKLKFMQLHNPFTFQTYQMDYIRTTWGEHKNLVCLIHHRLQLHSSGMSHDWVQTWDLYIIKTTFIQRKG